MNSRLAWLHFISQGGSVVGTEHWLSIEWPWYHNSSWQNSLQQAIDHLVGLVKDLCKLLWAAAVWSKALYEETNSVCYYRVFVVFIQHTAPWLARQAQTHCMETAHVLYRKDLVLQCQSAKCLSKFNYSHGCHSNTELGLQRVYIIYLSLSL